MSQLARSKRPSRLRPTAALRGICATTLALTATACGDDSTETAPKDCFELADGSCVKETFENPKTLEPNADGVYELQLQPTEFLLDGKRHCGRGYNGQYPGPTIDTKAAKPGEQRKVRVNLRNGFSKNDYQPVSDDAEEVCTCTDTESGESCASHGHGGSSTCQCTNTEGAICHVFDFNTTNLHFHGSHVRPDYAAGGGCEETDELGCRTCSGDSLGVRECFHSDNVLSRVGPGEGVQHRYDLDEDGLHHAGLSWYHPHIHGTTAIQVAGGAAGAWIVRGPLDEIPGIKNARERVMVLTTPPTNYTPLADDETCDEDHITFNKFATLNATPNGVNPQANLVNGMRRPRLVMPPGQIERWRIVDASFLDEAQLVIFKGKDSNCEELDLAAGPVPLTQIGRDGLALPKPADGKDWPFAPPYMFLSSGYRVEALLDGSKLSHGDTLCVMSARALQEDTTGTTPGLVGTLEPPTAEELLKAAGNGDLLAIVNVTNAAGTPSETEMPDLTLVAAESPSMMLQNGQTDALAKCEEIRAVSDLNLIDQLSALWLLFYNTEGLDKCGFEDHSINAKNFESTDREKYPYDRVLTKGAVDHWRVVSGFDGHPFHIHINPFLVCPLPPAGSPDPNAVGRLFEPPFAHWRDTYLVNLNRTGDFLTEYRAFTGDFVYHCHKLTHEDHGMMELLRICDPETEACDQLCDGQPCNWNTCAPGDDNCERGLVATKCLLDPLGYCPEAALRCTTCDSEQSCPAEAHCSEEPGLDDLTRCVPGCLTPEDCAITDTCNAGSCEPAPCGPPCMPPQMCIHGSCE
jgi:L-ascorbate oxidase